MSTPKTLMDLRYQDNVINITDGSAIETHARRWFNEVFGSTEEPKINYLFTEGDVKVYECYADSGSVDYLYIAKH